MRGGRRGRDEEEEGLTLRIGGTRRMGVMVGRERGRRV